MKKLIFLLILFYSQHIYSQQTDLLEIEDITTTPLSTNEYMRYITATSQRLADTAYVISLGDLATIQTDGIVEFELPDKNCLIIARSERVRYFDNNNYYWSAVVENEDENECYCKDGTMTIIKRYGRYIGYFAIDDDKYELEDLGEGRQVLVKLNFENEHLLHCDTTGLGNGIGFPDPGMQIRTNENCPVTLLALFTENAAAAVVNIEATIELAVEQANTAYQRSRVGHELVLVNILEDDFIENDNNNNIEADVNALAIDQGVAVLRAANNADLVVLFTAGNYFEGFSTILGRARDIGPDEDLAFAIIQAAEATDDFTFTHEVGHLYGCRHELEADNMGQFEHAHDFRHGCWPFRKDKNTIMWSIATGNTIQNFSNPNIKYAGKATGVSNTEENWRMLNTTNCEVAGFMQGDLLQMSGYISGPFAVCIGEEVFVEAVITGGAIGGYDFDWSYSYDGFNYTDLNENNCCVAIPGVNLPPTASGSYPIYIKLIVTDQNAATLTLFKSVESTNQDIGQEFPCTHAPRLAGPEEKNIQLYPNPVKELVTLQFQQNVIPHSVEVFNSQGVRFDVVSDCSGETSCTINTTEFLPGIYFVKFLIDDGCQIEKFIKH